MALAEETSNTERYDATTISTQFHIILLKTNDNQSAYTEGSLNHHLNDNDRYVVHLQNQHIPRIDQIDRVNLLKFELINLDALGTKLWKLLFSQNAMNCLILTSKQTIEAIEICLKQLLDAKRHDLDGGASSVGSLKKIVVYCVGQPTAGRFNEMIARIMKEYAAASRFINHVRFEVKYASKLEKCDSGANGGSPTTHKQNGLELSKLIIEDYKDLTKEYLESEIKVDTSIKYAMYPCSSIRRDDLSNALLKANITFDELHVYRTGYSQLCLESLRDIIDNDLKTHGHDRVICLVFFSPSCVDAIFKLDAASNQVSELSEMILANVVGFRFVSIGPSTSGKLREYVEDVYEMDEPSPQALEGCIRELCGYGAK